MEGRDRRCAHSAERSGDRCHDAWQLAEFYAALLGWTVVDRSEADQGGWALGELRRSQFQDFVDRATSLGAREAEHQPQPGRVLVMLDPAGHPFCLFPGR